MSSPAGEKHLLQHFHPPTFSSMQSVSCISILILTTFWSSMSSLSCMDIILTTIWSRLNTTNSTSSVTYETGLNSLLAVVDSYQVSSSIILLHPCGVALFVGDPDVGPTHPGGGVEGGADGGDGRSESCSHCRQPSQPQLAPHLLLQVMLMTRMVTMIIYLQESEHVRGWTYARLKDGWGWQ